jgi:hypothetical protein
VVLSQRLAGHQFKEVLQPMCTYPGERPTFLLIQKESPGKSRSTDCLRKLEVMQQKFDGQYRLEKSFLPPQSCTPRNLLLDIPRDQVRELISISCSKHFTQFEQQNSWTKEESRILSIADVSEITNLNCNRDSRLSPRIAASAEPGMKLTGWFLTGEIPTGKSDFFLEVKMM